MVSSWLRTMGGGAPVVRGSATGTRESDMLGSGSILVIPSLGSSSIFGFRERADKARLSRMFTEHYQLVFRVVRRMGVPPDAADDAAQQVFLVALERLGDIRPESERSFLYGTALRVARSERRKAIREPATDGADLLSSTEPLADVLADQKRAREVLDEVLERLDDDLRTVLVLHEFESLTMREIATIIDVPPGTVASRLRRAREVFMTDLRRALAPFPTVRDCAPRENPTVLERTAVPASTTVLERTAVPASTTVPERTAVPASTTVPERNAGREDPSP